MPELLSFDFFISHSFAFQYFDQAAMAAAGNVLLWVHLYVHTNV